MNRWALFGLLGTLFVGCPSAGRWPTLSSAERSVFDACYPRIRARWCPGDNQPLVCINRPRSEYANEAPADRTTWLIAHGCPADQANAAADLARTHRYSPSSSSTTSRALPPANVPASAATTPEESERQTLRAPRWPEVGAGVREAEMLCTRQSGRMMSQGDNFLCTSRVLREPIFGVQTNSDGTVTLVLVPIRDADPTEWRERFTARFGEPTMRVVDGVRRWAWGLPGQVAYLVPTETGIEIMFIERSAVGTPTALTNEAPATTP